MALTKAMGDEARRVATKAGFTPREAPKNGKPENHGFTISGTLAGVQRSAGSVQVNARFLVMVDGALSNVAMLDGRASADGGATAEDALLAVTESRVRILLDAIKAGRVTKLR
jgi:hypothetical protein